MNTIEIKELIGKHIFDGCNDYEITGYSYPLIYADALEYDEENDTFNKTGEQLTLTKEEVERDYKNDFGKTITICF